MHILLIHQYFQEKDDPGGLRWNAMTKLWAQQGHRITVIAGMTHYTKGIRHPKYNSKYTHTEEFDQGIRVIRTHVSDDYNTSFRGRLKAYFSFVWSGLYGGLFKARDRYDLIVVSSPPLSVGIIALTLSFFKRIPFVLEIRDLWPESAIDTGVLKNKMLIRWSFRLERRLYRKAKKINVVTPAMREVLIAKKNVHPYRILYIPNAADLDITEHLLQHYDPSALREQLGLNGTLSLCYVGAHGVANHLEQIIEAAELLKAEPVRFVLVGDGMQKKHLMQLTQDKKLQNIIFIDAVSKEQALQYILACDIGMSVLKKADTFKTVYSNKTFDYMACKKPVLMAIDGISRELVESADAGVFTEPENPADMAEKIRRYMQDPALRKRQGENGYAYVKKHFDRKILAAQYIDALQDFTQKQ